MPTVNELLGAGKDMQQLSIELANRTSYILAALQHQDNKKMRELIKSLYHLNWSFKDVASALEEISGEPGWEAEKMDYSKMLEASETYPWATDILVVEQSARQLHMRVTTIIQDLSVIGMELKYTGRFIARLWLDLHFLNIDLKDAGLLP